MDSPSEYNTSYYRAIIKHGKTVFKGRDDSHGKIHAKAVMDFAMEILRMDYPHQYMDLHKAVMMIAYFHDANDRKYEDSEGNLTKKTRTILGSLFLDHEVVLYHHDGSPIKDVNEFIEMALRIIKLISFTNEDNLMKKGIKINFEEELGTLNALIRHIVSDADKIDSLGERGIVRCRTYTIEAWGALNKNYDLTDLNTEIRRLFDTRFARLIDEFLRTRHGKELARPLLEEMEAGINTL
jgi:hypothetical protein